jgi:peptidoglycan/xylan/chitin deacetylase (PgdA/CDA1 family)
MSRFTGLNKDLRSGVIVAAIASTLLLLLLVSAASNARDDRGAFQEVFDSGHPVIAKHRGAVNLEQRNATVVPVLCHHFLRENTNPFELIRILGALFLNLPLLNDMDVWTQTASSFDQQLAYLKKHEYVSVDLDDLVAWRFGLKRLPEKSVVITFDDGDRSVLDVAYPILKKYGFKATLFVVTGQIGKDWDDVETLTWEELRSLQDSGVFKIESHTAQLHYKVKTSRGYRPVFLAMSEGRYDPTRGRVWHNIVLRDLAESRKSIATHLGHNARHLAWPYGIGGAELDSLAVTAGFRSMSTLDGGMNRPFLASDHHAEGGSEWPAVGTWVDARIAAVASADRVDPRFAVGILSAVLPGYPAAKIPQDERSIKRYTITARTSIRAFMEMLSQ